MKTKKNKKNVEKFINQKKYFKSKFNSRIKEMLNSNMGRKAINFKSKL